MVLVFVSVFALVHLRGDAFVNLHVFVYTCSVGVCVDLCVVC